MNRCLEAVRELEACVEREVREYGEEGYDEVKEMESEAPAPSPCEDRYNEVVTAMLELDGDLDAVELGSFHDEVHRRIALRRG